MKRRLSILFAVLAIVLLAAFPASAITFGTPDGDRHPNVGRMVARYPDGTLLLNVCTGTLIAPDVFLMASHCVTYLEGEGISLDRVWVSFDPVVDANAAFHHGTPVLNPQFGGGRQGISNDVAVILLDEPITGITPARLPAAGLLDEMKRAGMLRTQRFVTVGYGQVRDDKTGGPQSLADNNERRYAEQSFQALQPDWMQLSMNPSTGDGGTCYGDSGGPHFIGDSDVIAAITVTGDWYCRATDVVFRMDTAAARSFLGQFVDLP